MKSDYSIVDTSSTKRERNSKMRFSDSLAVFKSSMTFSRCYWIFLSGSAEMLPAMTILMRVSDS